MTPSAERRRAPACEELAMSFHLLSEAFKDIAKAGAKALRLDKSGAGL